MTDKAFKIYNRIRLVALLIIVIFIVYVANSLEVAKTKNIVESDIVNVNSEK